MLRLHLSHFGRHSQESLLLGLSFSQVMLLIMRDVADQNVVTQEYLDEIAKVNTPYTRLMHKYYGTACPFWDES